jgi:hypothetical protein
MNLLMRFHMQTCGGVSAFNIICAEVSFQKPSYVDCMITLSAVGLVQDSCCQVTFLSPMISEHQIN